MYNHLTISKANIQEKRYHTLVTHSFSHFDTGHLRNELTFPIYSGQYGHSLLLRPVNRSLLRPQATALLLPPWSPSRRRRVGLPRYPAALRKIHSWRQWGSQRRAHLLHLQLPQRYTSILFIPLKRSFIFIFGLCHRGSSASCY